MFQRFKCEAFVSENRGFLRTGPYKMLNKKRKWFRMNGLMSRLVAVLIVVLCSAGSLAAKDWRGILPLHSTRQDVERLLGPPGKSSPGYSSYSFADDEVIIIFSEEVGGYNINSCAPPVAVGTVLWIRVMPKAELSLKHLNLDESHFRKFNASNAADSEYEGLLNEAEGLVLRSSKGLVEEMVYLASALDRPRCAGVYSDLESFVTVRITNCGLRGRFDEWGDIKFSDEKARLDNLAIQLENDPQAKAHIIVYAGQKAVAAEAQLRGDRIKNYLLTVRKIDPQRVTIVDGGYMESLTVTVWLVPDGVEPPEPYPTVKPEDVQIIFEKPKQRGRKNR